LRQELIFDAAHKADVRQKVHRHTALTNGTIAAPELRGAARSPRRPLIRLSASGRPLVFDLHHVQQGLHERIAVFGGKMREQATLHA
jgi:hypothetical protein